jgi:ATP-dependent exoDNAse (exonuclease V) alpha subunit
MTVNKSQGSGFNKVAFFSSDAIESPLFSRRIIYTAITRAKNELALYLEFSKEEFYIPPKKLPRNSLLGWQNEIMEN